MNVIKDTKQSAAGLTIHLDRLTNVLQTECQHFSTVDVLVCSVGTSSIIGEKLKLMKELWAAEIRSTILDAEQVSVFNLFYEKQNKLIKGTLLMIILANTICRA